MKKFTLFSVLSLIVLFAFSQQKVDVEVSEKNMSKGSQMAVTVLIPEASLKNVEPLWKNYINNRGLGEHLSNLATSVGNIFKSDENKTSRDKLRVEKNGDELYVRSIKQPMISPLSLDIYARMTQMPEGCQFSTFFQYTDSVFLNNENTDAEQIQNMKSFIRDFGILAYKDAVDDQIKEAKKEVSKQENILKDLESDSKKREKQISRLESDIKEFEDEIVFHEKNIKYVQEKIDTTKIEVSLLVKGTPEYDLGKEKLKDLEKEKSKDYRNIKSLKSKIKSNKVDIKFNNSKIDSFDSAIKRQQEVIEEKEKIVADLDLKKENIR